MKVVCIDDHCYLFPVVDENDVVIGSGPPRPDDRFVGSLTIGKVYEVIRERLGMYAIVDDTGESYLYPKSRFRVVE